MTHPREKDRGREEEEEEKWNFAWEIFDSHLPNII